MIYSITGTLVSAVLADAHFLAVVEAGGIGYAVKTTHTTMAKMPEIGSRVTFYTYLYVREDALELFGFADLEELNCFKMLISISGVGPKAALSILSDMTPQKFALCVATGDSKGFTRSKGIGAETAAANRTGAERQNHQRTGCRRCHRNSAGYWQNQF